MGRRGRLILLSVAIVTALSGVSAVLVNVLGGPPGEGGRGYEVKPAASEALPPAPHPRSTRGPGPASGWIVTLAAPASYSASPGGPVIGNLPATNPFGAPQTLAVVGRPAEGWARVELPIRPNGSTAWIPISAVQLTWTSYSVTVDTSARQITVRDGTRVVLTAPAAVGAPNTFTPAGRTYLWELVRPDNPKGAYGPFIFGLAEFSDSYTTFNGGEAQIAIHGNDEPWSIGRPVSNGCVRVHNAVITRLAAMLPLGTPVTIT